MSQQLPLITGAAWLRIKAARAIRRRAVMELLLMALLWSIGGLLIKSINAAPLAIAGWRSAIGASVLLLLHRTNFNQPIDKRATLPFQWSRGLIVASIAGAAVVMLFVTANKLTTAANALLLQYSAPIYIALFAGIFLREPVRAADWFTIVLSLIGIALFFFDQLTITNYWGNICALACGIAYAIFVLSMRKQKDAAPLNALIIGNLLTAIVCLPYIINTHLTARGWLLLVLLGVAQLAIPDLLYARAIRIVSALEAVLIPTIEVILSPIWVYLLIGERPARWSLIGGAIILLAVTVRGVLAVLRPAQA